MVGLIMVLTKANKILETRYIGVGTGMCIIADVCNAHVQMSREHSTTIKNK